MKVLLVNASAPAYNLGLAKAANWWRRSGATVETRGCPRPFDLAGYDVVWLSAIFSWHVRSMIELALIARAFQAAVEVGGPGTFGLRDFIKAETGLDAQATPDPRFEREPGEYRMVFWSRGCPAKNCSLGYPKNGALPICSVPEMEGWRFTLFPDATPARVILDNNLSALPAAYQERIVARTMAAVHDRAWEDVDASSGFEPRSFRLATANLWSHLPLRAWRFAYDEIAEHAAVHRMIETLGAAGIPRRALRIYCLAGNEPVEACEWRVHEINGWGALPIVQRRRPLDWTGGPLPTLHDWTEQKLVDFQRWGNRLAKSMRFRDYVRGGKGLGPARRKDGEET